MKKSGHDDVFDFYRSYEENSLHYEDSDNCPIRSCNKPLYEKLIGDDQYTTLKTESFGKSIYPGQFYKLINEKAREFGFKKFIPEPSNG